MFLVGRSIGADASFRKFAMFFFYFFCYVIFFVDIWYRAVNPLVFFASFCKCVFVCVVDYIYVFFMVVKCSLVIVRYNSYFF